MNICFFIDSIFDRGGTQRITCLLANQLVELNYNVIIISVIAKNTFPFELNSRIKVYSYYKSPKLVSIKYFNILLKTSKIVNKESINILINVDTIQSLFTLPLKIWNKKLKIISWEHFNFKVNIDVKRRDYGRLLSLKYADAIVTLTNQDREFFLKKRIANVVCIPNFIKLLPLDQSSLDEKIVLAVGRFSYQKAFDKLIEVWKLVQNDHRIEGWTLNIIGNGPDKNVIKRRLTQNNLSSISIIDATPDIHNYYLTSSIYVMTSRFEGLPMVLLEAKSYGLPIVSFDCITGPRELIENNQDGYLIEMDDNQAMADAIIDLIQDKNKRLCFGKRAYENVDKYMVNNIIPLWENLFNSLISKRSVNK